MTDEENRVDPAVTELSRYKSLLKANDRRVVMTDIVKRLRTEGSLKDPHDVPALQRYAADEIERLRKAVFDLKTSAMAAEEHGDEGWHLAGSFEDRIAELHGFIETANEQATALGNENEELRGIIQQAVDDVVAASYPRTMHLEWLEAARKVLAKDD